MINKKDLENLEKGLKENSEEINKALKGCERHVPKKGTTMLIDGSAVIEICEKCGEMYERRPTLGEINYWNSKLNEPYNS